MGKYDKLVKKKNGPLVKIKFWLWQVCDFTIFNIKNADKEYRKTHRHSQFLVIENENFSPKNA